MLKQTFQEYKAMLANDLRGSRSIIKRMKKNSPILELNDLEDTSPEYADFLSKIPKAES